MDTMIGARALRRTIYIMSSDVISYSSSVKAVIQSNCEIVKFFRNFVSALCAIKKQLTFSFQAFIIIIYNKRFANAVIKRSSRVTASQREPGGWKRFGRSFCEGSFGAAAVNLQ